jgi:hypothetical protein
MEKSFIIDCIETLEGEDYECNHQHGRSWLSNEQRKYLIETLKEQIRNEDIQAAKES